MVLNSWHTGKPGSEDIQGSEPVTGRLDIRHRAIPKLVAWSVYPSAPENAVHDDLVSGLQGFENGRSAVARIDPRRNLILTYHVKI